MKTPCANTYYLNQYLKELEAADRVDAYLEERVEYHLANSTSNKIEAQQMADNDYRRIDCYKCFDVGCRHCEPYEE